MYAYEQLRSKTVCHKYSYSGSYSYNDCLQIQVKPVGKGLKLIYIELVFLLDGCLDQEILQLNKPLP